MEGSPTLQPCDRRLREESILGDESVAPERATSMPVVDGADRIATTAKVNGSPDYRTLVLGRDSADIGISSYGTFGLCVDALEREVREPNRRHLRLRNIWTAPAIPAAAGNAEANDVGIAVRMATRIPFPAARPRSSCGDPRCCMRMTAMPRATPIGTDAIQPVPRVATVPPKSMLSTTTTPNAAAGWIPMTPDVLPPPVLMDLDLNRRITRGPREASF